MNPTNLLQRVPERILIVRPSALGDVARTVGALASLKRHWPEAAIDWVVRDTFVDVVKSHPDLHEVIGFPRKKFRRAGRSLSVTREVLGYMRMLKGRGYDLVIDLQGLGRSGWLTWSTGAPKRVGMSDARELGWLGYTDRVKIDGGIVHTVDRMMAVVGAIGAPLVYDMGLHTSAEDDAWAAAKLGEHGVEAGKFAVIAPTAAWASKRWPLERFGEVIDGLGEFGMGNAVVVGSPGEEGQTRGLFGEQAGGVGRIDLVGQTTVGQMMAVIKQAGLVFANDSAALHIAIGLGKRVVSMFGPTDPAEVGPYGYEVGTVCAAVDRPVNYRAQRTDDSIIGQITTGEVMEAGKRVMEAEAPVMDHGAG